MSKQTPIQAPYQLPCSVVILSTSADGKQGAMTATAMYVSERPPIVVVSVSKTFATHRLIETSKAFVINVIADDQLELSERFGSVHGFEVDKFKDFNITTEPASKIKALVISGCFSNIECWVKTSLWETEGNHSIYIADVIAFKVNEQLRPMVWLKGRYYRVGTECKI